MSRYRLLALISAFIVVIDQATKLYVDANFRLHESLPVIRGFFHLTFVFAKGMGNDLTFEPFHTFGQKV